MQQGTAQHRKLGRTLAFQMLCLLSPLLSHAPLNVELVEMPALPGIPGGYKG